ncbi:MAG: VWA domain-containing protein, partial [Lachnospiraceae bacterium]|nr:VWA domain-containing protein [Lachnospiraceae bacterium]
MMKKRFWALFLAVMMVVSVLPTSAFAAEGTGTPVEGEVTATKTLVENDDGTYTITLSVQGNPVKTNTQPNADVVLVVDNSGSMASSVGTPCESATFEKKETIDLSVFATGLYWDIYECPVCHARYIRSYGKLIGYEIVEFFDARPEKCTGEIGRVVRMDAAIAVSKEFASSILDIEGNQIAVIGFAHQNNDGGADDTGAIKVAQELTDNLDVVKSKIDSMDANGGTNYSAALQEAYNYLYARSNADKENYVIFISDGAPGRSGESFNDRNWNGADQVAALKKAGITVYTVGIALDTSAANYLKSMASEKQSDHFINVTGDDYQDQLSDILEQWAEKIKTVPAGKNAVMTDIVDTDKFTIEDYDDGLTLAADGKTLTWSIGNIPEETATITITVSAKDGVHGSNIPTNKNVYLTYTPASSDTSVTIPEAEIGKPVVDIDAPVTYTVTYDANGGAFAEGFDNEFEDLYAGNDMPTIAADDEPTRDGYNFIGWGEAADSTEPADIPATVSGNVTYYAIWEKILTYPVTYTYEPAGVPAAAPTNQYTYSVGQQVTVAAKPDDVKVGGGTWKFQQWTLNGVEVAANSKVDMVEGGLNFIGIWEYEADKPAEYPVTYTYEPAGVPAAAPTNQYTYSVGQQVTVAAKPDDVKV